MSSSPREYVAVLIVGTNGEARLDLVQALDFKVLELLSLRLAASPEAVVRAHVTYRCASA